MKYTKSSIHQFSSSNYRWNMALSFLRGNLGNPYYEARPPPLEISNSYRPIAVSSCIGILIRKIIHSRLDMYLENTNAYHSFMSVFRRGHDRVGNLLYLVECVKMQNVQNNVTVSVLFFLSSGFGRHCAQQS